MDSTTGEGRGSHAGRRMDRGPARQCQRYRLAEGNDAGAGRAVVQRETNPIQRRKQAETTQVTEGWRNGGKRRERAGCMGN